MNEKVNKHSSHPRREILRIAITGMKTKTENEKVYSALISPKYNSRKQLISFASANQIFYTEQHFNRIVYNNKKTH